MPRDPRQAVALMFVAAVALGAAGLALVPRGDLSSVSAPQPLAATLASAEASDPTAAELAEMTRTLGTPSQARTGQERFMSARAKARARQLRRERRQMRRLRAAQVAAAKSQAAEPEAPYWWDDDAARVPGSRPSMPADAWLRSGRGGWVDGNGYARPPYNAPAAIKRVIYAGNAIARAPYEWGGGHGQWRDKGYDCSGSISYALAAGGMLGYSQNSAQLMRWGVRGAGRWLTVYASPGHVFMEVAGLRFDTSGAQGAGSRWQLARRSTEGYAVRHYPGL